jgi:hypothetical protein
MNMSALIRIPTPPRPTGASGPRRRVRLLAALGAALLAALALTLVPAALAGRAKPVAHASASFLTGIGDQETEMFGNPLWKQLHTKIARYIAPYDAAVRPYSLQAAARWIADAEAQHQQVLIAFYHSEYTPTRMPSVAAYTKDVQRFVKLFPRVRQYQAWNETNRGTIVERVKGKRHVALVSPSPTQSAEYYKALRAVCKGCTITGLDILDGPTIAPSLRYLAQFKRALAHLKVPMPHLWGFHNYSDTNRFSSSRTRAILAAVPGEVWLTETGGIVKFGGAFPNVKGSGLRRASKALTFMFHLAASNPRIKRLYVFQWSGSHGSVRFDAGLMDPHYNPRPGYVVVCKALHAAKCKMKTSDR